MNVCTAGIPSGKSECDKLLKKTKYALISRPEVVYDTLDDFKSLYRRVLNINTPNAKQLLNSHLLEVLPPENTTDDVNVITLANTQKVGTNKPLPSVTMYAKTSFAGSQTLLNTLDGNYKIEFFGEDLILLGTYNPQSLKYSGFDCNIFASTKGIPSEADPEKMVLLYVNFSNFEQFLNSEAQRLNWNAGIELRAEQPDGMKMKPESKYTFAVGTYDVLITDSAGDGVEDLVTADFIVLDSNKLVSVAITATEDTLKGGRYSLAITKEVIPVNLEAGDTIDFQVQVKGGLTPVTSISNPLTINVLA